MRLSRSNQAFGMTGLVIASIGLICYLSSSQRTSIIQSVILLASGTSLFIIAFLNMIINQIRLLKRRFYNPLNGWSPKGRASIFNFKG